MRELLWRKEAIAMEEWDRVAWICFFMPRWVKTVPKLEQFHPLRNSMVNVSELNAWVKEQCERLPDRLTEEEIERRWEKYVGG